MALGVFRKSVETDPDTNNDTKDASYAENAGPPSSEGKMRRLSAARQKSIAGVLPGEDSEGSPEYSIQRQVDQESTNSIQYRTCSWQKTAALLFSEYICLAIMSFPWSYSLLGLFPGLLLTFAVALVVLYTSLTVWEMCMRHPECKDVCDVAEILFGNKWGRWFTIIIFLLNNTFIQGFHCLTGAKYLNTMTNHSVCTIGFSGIIAVIGWICSMPRTFSTLSKLATLSAFFTFVSVLLATIFAAIEDHPTEYPKYGPKKVSAWPPPGTSFVLGMNAFLNISYTFIGQITLPSFIAEMKDPKDFPKALYAVTIAEVLIFSLVGSVIYAYTGYNYMVTPAFGSLGNTLYEKVSFSFMIPTIIFLGVLYASVSSRFIFNSIFNGTRHMGNHTVVGWASWAGILGCTWVVAFIIAEVIPFFGDLLSLMSSLFDSFFGFIFWGWAYLRLRRLEHGEGFWKIRGFKGYVGAGFNIFLIGVGIFFLTVGTYVSIRKHMIFERELTSRTGYRPRDHQRLQTGIIWRCFLLRL